MAKKKATAPARPAKPASSGKTKKQPASKQAANNQSATTAAAKSNSTPKTAASNGQRPISNALIGETAGKVWQRLAAKNGQTLAALKKSVQAPDDHVLAAVGWLAREDKLAFEASGRTIKVTLR